MFLISRKTFLAKNLKKMRKLFSKEYDFFPKTWILPNEINELRYFHSNTVLKKIDSHQKKDGKFRFPQFKVQKGNKHDGFTMIVKPD